MPRNGSGSFSLAEAAFVPNTPISSSAVNSDLSDIGDALTGSLARDGQGGMTAVLPLANAGFTYLTDPNTGMRRTAADTQAISVGGIDIMTFTASSSLLGGTFQINAGTSLVDASITYAKIQDVAASRLLGNPTGAPADVSEISLGAGMSFVGTSLVSTINPTLIQGYISGLNMSAVGGTSTFGIAAGVATDSTNAVSMVLASGYNKTTASWAVGSGNGSLDAGSIANGTWYHVYLIERVDTGVTDILTSTNATAPTLPTNYTLFRRIGSVLTDGSAHYIAFRQVGDQFLWSVPVADIISGAASTTPAAKTLSTPFGVSVIANLSLSFTNTVAGGNKWLVYSEGTQAVDTPLGNYSLINPSTGQFAAGQFSIRTDTSRQIFSVASAAANNSIGIVTTGWIDNRGKS